MKDHRRNEVEDEDAEALLSGSEKDWEKQRVGRPEWLTAVSFILSVSFALTGGIILGRYMFFNKNSVCTAHVSQNSTFPVWKRQTVLMETTAPLLNQIDLSYNIIRFNGSFLKENIYRHPGSPEVDAAWEALGVNCTQGIQLISGVSSDENRVIRSIGGCARESSRTSRLPS